MVLVCTTADGAALAVRAPCAVISSGEMLVLAVVAHRMLRNPLGLLMDNLRIVFPDRGAGSLQLLGYFSTYLAQHHLSALSDLAVLQAVACGSDDVVLVHPINERVIHDSERLSICIHGLSGIFVVHLQVTPILHSRSVMVPLLFRSIRKRSIVSMGILAPSRSPPFPSQLNRAHYGLRCILRPQLLQD